MMAGGSDQLPPEAEADTAGTGAPAAPPPEAERQYLLLRLLPNFASIIALCAGLTAIRFAVSGNVNAAVLLIALAAFLDGVDGRLARMLRSESAIGAELDSLCDFVNFGVVPALVLYLWDLRGEANLGWIAVLIYAVCCMLRLARFNVGNKSDAPQEKTGFIGVPSPAGAMLVLLPVYIGQAFGARVPEELAALWMIAVGAMMISRLRTPSLKRVTVSSSNVPFVLVGAVAGVALVLTYPWVTLMVFTTGYLMAILWGWGRQLRDRARAASEI